MEISFITDNEKLLYIYVFSLLLALINDNLHTRAEYKLYRALLNANTYASTNFRVMFKNKEPIEDTLSIDEDQLSIDKLKDDIINLKDKKKEEYDTSAFNGSYAFNDSCCTFFSKYFPQYNPDYLTMAIDKKRQFDETRAKRINIIVNYSRTSPVQKDYIQLKASIELEKDIYEIYNVYKEIYNTYV
jgi:hypothetical protein